MAHRLADAISPYLRSHADNPVDWWPWGAAAFAEAERRDVPVLVSIGYSTCHWCHVMARESFSDPIVAAYLNDNFVAIKVDREEHPDVDAAYMAAAGAFTRNLGWPLNVVTTPGGAPFFAGSYFPPRPAHGRPEFLSVLGAVVDAWTERRAGVDAGADALVAALHAASESALVGAPVNESSFDTDALARVVAELLALEDEPYGGFGTAPKFPMAPLLQFLIETPGEGRALGLRTLKRMGASPLRDPVDGGFFRYATGRDWSEPHYERMLADNALLLDAATSAWLSAPTENTWARSLMEGVAGLLVETLRLPGEGFASAQDSESVVDGVRVEGGYYRRDAAGRAVLPRPALDEKVLTGWNGLAIAALARAGRVAEREDWVVVARETAKDLTSTHLDAASGRLVRASLGGRISAAPATLEDYGMLAEGLIQLALASGEVRYAEQARTLVEATLTAGADGSAGIPFAVPGGADATLAAHGMALTLDISEGASPSGYTAIASAAWQLYALGAGERFLGAVERMVTIMAPLALERPIAYGGVLGLLSRTSAPLVQLIVVAPDGVASGTAELNQIARAAPVSVVAELTETQAEAFAGEGFEIFRGKIAGESRATAYLCRDFSCRLPTSDAEELGAELVALAEAG